MVGPWEHLEDCELRDPVVGAAGECADVSCEGVGIARHIDDGPRKRERELRKHPGSPPARGIEQCDVEEGIPRLESVCIPFSYVGSDAEGSCVVSGILNRRARRLDEGQSAGGVGKTQSQVADSCVQIEQMGRAETLEAGAEP